MNDNSINKLNESVLINNTDYIPFDKVQLDGRYNTNKISYNTLNSVLSADIINNLQGEITNLQNNINLTIDNINKKLDKRGLTFSPNNKMTGSLVLNSDLSASNFSHFNKNINLNFNRIINLSGDEFCNDYDAVNKSYVNLKIQNVPALNVNNYVKKSGDTMTGFLSSSVYPPTVSNAIITKEYLDSFNINDLLPISGGSLTGNLSVTNFSNNLHCVNKSYVDSKLFSSDFLFTSGGELTGALVVPAINNSSSNYIADVKYTSEKIAQFLKNIPLSGGSLTGNLSVLSPVLENEIVSKKYVDDNILIDPSTYLKLTGGTLSGQLNTVYPPVSANHVANLQYLKERFGDAIYLKKTGGESNNLSASSNGIAQLNKTINLTSNGFIDLSGSNFYTINLSANCSGFNINIDPNKFYDITLFLKTLYPSALFAFPSGIVKDSSDNLFVCDSFNHTIRKITSEGMVSTFAGTALSSGIADGTGSAARFNNPTGITIDSSDNLFVCDNANYTIRKITPVGVVTTFAGTAGSAGSTDGTGSNARFAVSYGITIDSSNNLFVCDNGNQTIRKITPVGVVTTFAGTAGSVGSTDGTGSNARFRNPLAITIDSSNNLFVCDSSNQTIRKITPVGVVTTFAGTAGSGGTTDGTGSAARFNNPTGITIDSSNNLFVCDSGNQTIRKITSARDVSTFAGTALSSGITDGTGNAARFNNPTGITIDSSNNLFVTDRFNNTIRVVTSAAEVTTFKGKPRFSGSTDDINGYKIKINWNINSNNILFENNLDYDLSEDSQFIISNNAILNINLMYADGKWFATKNKQT
jgi:streptogramin lyase